MSGTAQWITAENIDLQLTAQSELETIAAMLELARQSDEVKNVKQLAQELLHHEVMASSLTGCCAVVFQALSSAVAAPKMFFGRFDRGIGYRSKNNRPIDLVVLIVAPPEERETFARMVQKVELGLCETRVREQLRAAKSVEEALQVLRQILSDSIRSQ